MEEPVFKAREKVRVRLAEAAKFQEDIANGRDLSDIPPHLWGKA